MLDLSLIQCVKLVGQPGLENIWEVPCNLAPDWILANRAIGSKTLALQGFQPSFQMSS